MSRYVEFLFSIALIAACLWVNLTQYPVVWDMLESDSIRIGRDEAELPPDEGDIGIGDDGKNLIADHEADPAEISVNAVPKSVSATSESKYAGNRSEVPVPPAPIIEEIGEKTTERKPTRRISNPPIPTVTRE